MYVKVVGGHPCGEARSNVVNEAGECQSMRVCKDVCVPGNVEYVSLQAPGKLAERRTVSGE